MKRKYNFKKLKKNCVGCQKDFLGHSNTKYCSSKCKNKNSEWAKQKQYNRISNLEFFLKEKINLAKNRNKYSVTVSYEDLKMLYEKQQGLCALSGVPMTYLKGSGEVPTNISLDRIDPDLPYSIENIQLVCVQVNFMKHTLNKEQLIFWCKRIIENES